MIGNILMAGFCLGLLYCLCEFDWVKYFLRNKNVFRSDDAFMPVP